MYRYFYILAIILLYSCLQENQEGKAIYNNKKADMEIYNVFDQKNHLRPDFDKSKFDRLHDWDLGWELLEPINLAKSRNDDKELSKRFSPGQKALYFFWYLDAQVTNGGFLQFYSNGYGNYVPTINAGLKLIGDNKLLALMEKVEQEYLVQEELNSDQIEKNTWEPNLSLLTTFDQCNSEFYRIHDNTMKLIEKYVRQHPDEFIKLK